MRAYDAGLHLNEPIFAQYITFLGAAVRLHFGYSLGLREPVGVAIRDHAGPTALLIVYSMIIALAIAVPLSLVVAKRRGSLIDHGVRGLGMISFAMPPFWLGLILVLGLSVAVPLFPVSGYASGFTGELRSLTLPALTLGLLFSPVFIRTLRASLLEVLDSEFVEASRARGLSERRVLYRHALRPSSLPLVTLVGLTLGSLLSYTVVVENVFGIPGLGALLVTAVTNRDFPLVQGLVVVLGLAVVLINLATDLLYGCVDPRVRLMATR